MKNDHYQSKHARGSSPHQEQKPEVDHSVKDLRTIEQGREDSQTTHDRESSVQKLHLQPQSSDESRWQDDGGECS
jgi:hypothetical protein